MSKPLPRRSALKTIGAGSAILGLPETVGAQEKATTASDTPSTEAPSVNWSDTHDRVWLAGNCWVNPMEDWVIRDGAAECSSTGGDRNIHLITHQLTDAAKPLHINGDQHLTSLSQYGVDKQRDAFWSFCTPTLNHPNPCPSF